MLWLFFGRPFKLLLDWTQPQIQELLSMLIPNRAGLVQPSSCYTRRLLALWTNSAVLPPSNKLNVILVPILVLVSAFNLAFVFALVLVFNIVFLSQRLLSAEQCYQQPPILLRPNLTQSSASAFQCQLISWLGLHLWAAAIVSPASCFFYQPIAEISSAISLYFSSLPPAYFLFRSSSMRPSRSFEAGIVKGGM